MTTQRTDNDVKKAGGYLKEKFTIVASRISHDEVVRAIAKVSSHKLKLPNEKHMLRLLQASYGFYNAGKTVYADVNDFIVTELEKRTHVHDWIVVLKTFLVMHRLMHDGSEDVNKALHNHRRIFCGSYIKDLADTTDGALQQRVISQYSRYLEERLCCEATLRPLGFGWHRIESEEFSQALGAITDIKKLSTVMAPMLLLLEVMLDIEYTDAVVSNEATLQLFENLVQDAKRLYVVLTDRIKVYLDAFDGMPSAGRKLCLEVYSRYHKAVSRLSGFFQSMRNGDRHFVGSIPDMHPLPQKILDRMEEAAVVGGTIRERGGSPPPVEQLHISDETAPPATVTVESQPATRTARSPSTQNVPPPLQPVQAQPSGNLPRSRLSDLFSPVEVKAAPTTHGSAPPVDLFAQFETVDQSPAVSPATASPQGSPQASFKQASPVPEAQPHRPASTQQQPQGKQDSLSDLFSQPQRPPPKATQQPVHAEFDPFADHTPAPKEPERKPETFDFFAAPAGSRKNSGTTPPPAQQYPGKQPTNTSSAPPVDPFTGKPRAW